MTSKEKILDSIRKNNIVKDVKLPSYENFELNLKINFKLFQLWLRVLVGKALVINKEDLDKTIKELYPDEKQIVCNVEVCSLGTLIQIVLMMPMI